MVQDILPSILPAVVADLREWTVSLRLNAARCLQSVLLLAGAASSAHLPYLLSPLCSAAGDEEGQVAQYVVQAAQVCPTTATAMLMRPIAMMLQHTCNS